MVHHVPPSPWAAAELLEITRFLQQTAQRVFLERRGPQAERLVPVLAEVPARTARAPGHTATAEVAPSPGRRPAASETTVGTAASALASLREAAEDQVAGGGERPAAALLPVMRVRATRPTHRCA